LQSAFFVVPPTTSIRIGMTKRGHHVAVPVRDI
jgi:hypothetical protein